MDPGLIIAVEKLNKLLDTLTGKKGVPADENLKKRVITSEGTTLTDNVQPKFLFKTLGAAIEVGKYEKKASLINKAKVFTRVFLPKLSQTLDKSLTPLKATLDKMLVKLSGLVGGGGEEGEGGGFGISSIFKSSNIIKFLLAIAGTAGVVMLFKKALEGWEGIETDTLIKVGSVIGTVGLLIFALGKISTGNITKGVITLGFLELLLYGLTLVLPPLAKTAMLMEGVTWENLGKIGAIIGSVAVLVGALGMISLSVLITGSLTLAGIIGIIYLLNQVLPPLAESVKLIGNVEWSALGKVATIIGGIAALAGALGLIAMTGVGALAFTAGAAVIAGAIGIAYLLIDFLPPMAQAIKSMEGVNWEDIGKVATIIGGLEVALAAAGALSLLIAPGLLVFKGMINVADEMQSLLPKIATAIKSISDLSETDINKAFDLLRSFMTGSGVLFSGEGFFGKVGSFFKNLVGGTSAAVLMAPYTSLAYEISILSSSLKTAIKNLLGIGTEDNINTAMNLLRVFFTSAAGLSEIAPAKSLREMSQSVMELVSIISGVTTATKALDSLSQSFKNLSAADTFKVFETTKEKVDSLTDSINNLKSALGDITVKPTINIVSDRPLKVDMSTTNDILLKIYQSSVEMINAIKAIPASGGGNIMLPPQQQGGGAGRPNPSNFLSYSSSPYSAAGSSIHGLYAK